MRFVVFFRLVVLVSGYFLATSITSSAQCVTPISVFPYSEGFEATDGGWVPGGVSSDWAWGAPAKPVITGAGAGANCWITGGLTGSSYNNSENSWLQSPCFDFTTLVNPRISFLIFWETEKRFDGANMEYSTNDGGSWTRLGSTADGPCTASNWYNNGSITYLGNTNGWSGNIQSTSGSCQGGSGSNGWLNAMHDLSFLAGAPSVIFRFRFGAGTTCNSYDGFAFDDVVIDETPPNSGDFTYTCSSNRNVSFTSTTTGCVTTYAWDFNDPASGPNNTSALANPTHTFSTAGIYNVSLTITYGTGAPIVVSYTIEILDVNINLLVPITCNGGTNGAIVAVVSGGSGSYTYVWNTVPPQTTFDLNNIGAGTYTVQVSSAAACNTSATYVLTEPAAVNVITNLTNEACSNSNGSITATVTGGTSPYFYNWSTGAITSSITNLSAGIYFLNVLDVNGCPVFVNNLVISNVISPVTVSLGPDISACPGQRIILNPGTFSSYLWQDNSSNSVYNVTSAGTYRVTVTNSIGCTGSDTVVVNMDCADLYFPGAFTPNNDSKNDGFGPIGTMVSQVRNYTLRVYNRYGQMIFYSTDPYQKWDGTSKGIVYNIGTYTWFATYNIAGKAPDQQTGTVVLIR